MPINRSDIEQNLRDQIGLSKDQAKKATAVIEATILQGLSEGKTVNWMEFLTLKPMWTEARNNINPRTKEPIVTPAQWRVKAHVAPNVDKVVKSLPPPT